MVPKSVFYFSFFKFVPCVQCPSCLTISWLNQQHFVCSEVLSLLTAALLSPPGPHSNAKLWLLAPEDQRRVHDLLQ